MKKEKHEKHDEPAYFERNPKAMPISKEKAKKFKGFKVKTYSWKKGELVSSEAYADSFDDALGYANAIGSQLIKIYNENDELVHTSSKPVDTYA